MIACQEVLEPDQLTHSLPAAPFEERDCQACNGHGGFISLHPLYAGVDPCGQCDGRGTFLVEAEGDPTR